MIATLFANAEEPWPLRAGVAHVWRFACEQELGDRARVLSPDEHRAANRLLARVHRDRYLVQHALQRALLARYVGVAPEAVELERGPRGKPRVAGVGHNLSHTDDVALLAVTRELEVGIDVERLDAALDIAGLSRVVLAPDEAVGDRRAFLRIWCRKEACLKATGDGLVDDLKAISVQRDRTTIRGVEAFVQDLALDAEHAAALATTTRAVADVAPRARETFSW